MIASEKNNSSLQIIRYAGIDIGSNAARLIIKDVLPGERYDLAVLKKRLYVRLPIRLGNDVFEFGKIKKKKENDFIKAMVINKNLMDYYNVNRLRACATSAMRNAENNNDIIQKIDAAAGIKIDIIDIHEEANLIFETNKYLLPEDNFFLSADLGGGSLQLTLFKSHTLFWSDAYKIGTLRMLKKKVSEDEINRFENDVKYIMQSHKNAKLLGTGGNINTISKIYRNKTVPLTFLKALYKELKPLTLTERIQRYFFRPDRADVIIPALKIYIKLMEIMQNNTVYVPKTGLADGIIRQLYEDEFK